MRTNKLLTKQDLKYLEGILWEELGLREKYEKIYGDTSVIKVVGLERQAAVKAFSEFIIAENLNLQQTKFVGLIINYIMKNGIFERQALQQDPISSLGGLRSYSRISCRKRKVYW